MSEIQTCLKFKLCVFSFQTHKVSEIQMFLFGFQTQFEKICVCFNLKLKFLGIVKIWETANL